MSAIVIYGGQVSGEQMSCARCLVCRRASEIYDRATARASLIVLDDDDDGFITGPCCVDQRVTKHGRTPSPLCLPSRRVGTSCLDCHVADHSPVPAVSNRIKKIAHARLPSVGFRS